jgi:hypothetical protein
VRLGNGIRNLTLAAAITLSSPVLAGPPFITDDPEPTDTGHFENYLYVQGTRAGGATSGPAEGIEINYGAAPDTQLTLSVPIDSNPGAGSMGSLYAPLGAGVKYRFIEEDDDGWRPQVAVFPQIAFPVGSASRSVPTTLLLPLWAQKSSGAWTCFGGGGIVINPGGANRDFLVYGGALLRQIDDRLQIGLESFGASRSATATGAGTAIGLGAILDLSEHWHLIGSVNAGLVNARGADAGSYVFAVKWTL